MSDEEEAVSFWGEVERGLRASAPKVYHGTYAPAEPKDETLAPLVATLCSLKEGGGDENMPDAAPSDTDVWGIVAHALREHARAAYNDPDPCEAAPPRVRTFEEVCLEKELEGQIEYFQQRMQTATAQRAAVAS